MNNWYTIGIVFLGGLAAGLLGFLFIKPAQTGHQDPSTVSTNKISDSSDQLTESSSSSDNTESSQPSETATDSAEQDASSEPSQTEEWTANADKSTTPELIFYYKPG